MKAIIVTGGKQYTVSEGDVIFVEKLNAEAESTVKFEEVLAVRTARTPRSALPLLRALLSRLRS